MRPDRAGLAAGVLLVLVGIAPMVVTMIAAAIANGHGCRLDEGDAYPCVILGRDWGGTLYAMGMTFWLELLTFWLVPVGVVALVIGFIRRWRSRRPAPVSTATRSTPSPGGGSGCWWGGPGSAAAR